MVYNKLKYIQQLDKNKKDISKMPGEHIFNLGSNSADQIAQERERERLDRIAGAERALDAVGESGWFQENWNSKEDILDFLKDKESILGGVVKVNAAIRGIDPIEARSPSASYTYLMHVPARADKPKAFNSGYQAIREYIGESDDDTDTKIAKVARAVESLIAWTHYSDDGNGRTARFWASIIESGGEDFSKVIDHTVSRYNRGKKLYNRSIRSKEAALFEINHPDLVIYDDQKEEILKQIDSMPDDIEAMYLDVKGLLEADSDQEDNAEV